jgi:hypothetical protein
MQEIKVKRNMGQVVISIISGALFGAIIVFLIHINIRIGELKQEIQWLKRKIGGFK